MSVARNMISHFIRSMVAFLLMLPAKPAFAQVVNTDTLSNNDLTNITRYLDVLKTTTLIGIDSVRSPASQRQFVQAPDKQIVFAGYDQYYYWFRMVLRNDNPAPKELRLSMAPIGMSVGQLYQKRNDGWKLVAVTGYSIPFAKRPYLYAHYVFPFTIGGNITDTLYLSMDGSHAFKSYGFVLSEPKALKTLENKVYFSLGVIIGILMLFGLFNIYLWITLKERIHLWYTLHIALILLLAMKNEQLDQEFLGWDNEVAYRMTSLMGIGAIAMAVLVHVIFHFLTVIHNKRVLSNLTMAVKWNALVSGICQLIVFTTGANHVIKSMIYVWSNYSTMLAIAVIMIDCMYSIYKDRKSTFFLAAILVFLIGGMLRLSLIGIPAYFKPPHPFHYGLVLETFIITFGLIYRYRLERKEKDRYLKEKEMLEKNRERVLLESKLEIKEQTLRTTLKEINTNIGRKILSVKENLAGLHTAQTEAFDTCLHDSRNLLTRAIADLRNVCRTLDTDYVRDMGLLKSIEYELEQCRNTGACNKICKTIGEPYKIDPQKELVLFRIYQEVLNNMNRYGNSGQILVVLSFETALFQLTISYNGTDAEKLNVNQPGSGNDLLYRELQNRVSLIGGTMAVAGEKTKTKIMLAIPREETEAPAFATRTFTHDIVQQ